MGEVEHLEGHEGGVFESSEAAGAPAVALLSTKQPLYSWHANGVRGQVFTLGPS